MSKSTATKTSKKSREPLSDNLASEALEVAERVLDLRRREQVAEGDLLLIRIEMGGVLHMFKHQLLYHGQFIDWVRTKCGINLKTAERCMNLWLGLGDKKTTLVSNLGLTKGYLVTAPDTPKVVRIRVFERLEAGDSLSAADIRRMIAAAKAEQKRLEQEQKRLKEKRRQRKSAAELQPADPVDRENDDVEEPVTEPLIVDGAVDGTRSACQAEGNTVESAASSNPADVAGGGPLAEEPVITPPLAEGSGGKREPTPDPGSVGVEAEGGPDHADGADDNDASDDPGGLPLIEGPAEEPIAAPESAGNAETAGGLNSASAAGNDGSPDERVISTPSAASAEGLASHHDPVGILVETAGAPSHLNGIGDDNRTGEQGGGRTAEAAEQPPRGADSADKPVRPEHEVYDDGTGELAGGGDVAEEAGAEPQTFAPGRDGLEPEGGSNQVERLGDARLAEQTIGAPPLADETADGPEPAPDPVSSTIQRAARSELAAGAGQDSSETGNGRAHVEEAPEPPRKAEKTAVKQGELPLVLSVSPHRAGADDTQSVIPVAEQQSSTAEDYDSPFIQVARSFVDFFRPTPNQDELSKLLAFYDFEAHGNTVVIATSFYIGRPPRRKIDAPQMKRDYSVRIDRMITVTRGETGLHIARRPSDHCERCDE